MEPYEKVERSRKDIIVNNFLGGLFWGIGSTVIFVLLTIISGIIISKIDVPKLMSGFLTSTVQSTAKENPQLFK